MDHVAAEVECAGSWGEVGDWPYRRQSRMGRRSSQSAAVAPLPARVKSNTTAFFHSCPPTTFPSTTLPAMSF